jgi:SAM-dependent methyltransferase
MESSTSRLRSAVVGRVRGALDRALDPYVDRLRERVAAETAAGSTPPPVVEPPHEGPPSGTSAAEPLPEPAAQRGLTLEEFRERLDQGELSAERSPEATLMTDELVDLSLDPLGEDYRDVVMAAWSRLTGRPSYDASSDEAFEVDPDTHLGAPWPYISRDPVEVAHYFGAVAATLERLGHAPPATVVEFGAGWGHMSLMLASTGYRVTAVDLNPSSVALLRRRAQQVQVELDVVQSSFLDYQPPEPVDVIVFYEAFHHCDRPFELLDRCIAALAPGGRLVFVADAFYEDYYAPWGLRPDGGAALMSANEGWLELGFDRGFFRDQLHRRGLTTTWEHVEHLGAHGTYLIGTRC